MKNNSIEINDPVLVFLNPQTCFDGIVKYIPVATGDSWVITDSSGRPHYVQTFQEIVFNGIVETPPPQKDEEPCPF